MLKNTSPDDLEQTKLAPREVIERLDPIEALLNGSSNPSEMDEHDG